MASNKREVLMGLFDEIKASGASYRLTEEALYAEALREIESGQRRDGIWAKAMSGSGMDVDRAGAKYIKLRVQSLRDEATLLTESQRKSAEQLQTASTRRLQDERNRAQSTQSSVNKNSKGEGGSFLTGALIGGVICIIMLIIFVVAARGPIESTGLFFSLVAGAAVFGGLVSAGRVKK